MPAILLSFVRWIALCYRTMDTTRKRRRQAARLPDHKRQLLIHVTESQRAEVEQAAAHLGISMSEFCRRALSVACRVAMEEGGEDEG